MDRFWSLFGKLVFFVIIIGGLVGAGVVIGSKYFANQDKTQNITPTAIPSKVVSVTPSQTATSSAGTTSMHTDKSLKTQISAGGAKPFVLYTILVVSGWNVGKEHDDSIPTDKLTLTKGDYSLVISQGPSGGARCVYPGDPQGDFSSPFVAFTPVPTTQDANFFRRSKVQDLTKDGKQGYTICQKNTDGTYGDPTLYGHINYLVPGVSDSSTLTEMDSMIGSLQKQ